jgi:Flp pilus assembly protein TadB
VSSLIIGLSAIFAALFIVVLTLFGSRARAGERRDLAGRIARYGPRHGPGQVSGDQAAASRAGNVALDMTKRLMSPEVQRRLSARLELAGITRKPAEWVLFGCGLGLVTAAAVSVLTDVVIGVLVGVAVGWGGMHVLLNFLIRRRRGAFAEQLPDLLQILASSLQSGFSLLQALDAAVREAAQPAGGEFARALAEVRLGADLEDALETVAVRMGSEDLRWTVMAIRIQRGIGGNLAEVLTTTVNTIRERGYLRRHVRALSAEGRLSAYVLIVLPVVVSAFLFVVEPAYMRPLYATHIGQAMLAGAVVLMATGTALMRQMIKIEV